MKMFFSVSFILISQLITYPQPLQVNNFFNDLIKSGSDLSHYIQPDEFKKSSRLGIKYEDVHNKFLISYDIDELVKQKINKGEFSYRIIYKQLEDEFSKAVFTLNEDNYNKDFYFKNEKLISPSSYFTRNWETKESKYFKVLLSEPDLFNDYSLHQLDNFTDAMSDLLKIPQSEKKLIEQEKILYILCRDEEEIKKISGFKTRGIYILAYDEIITTYNCHFHEIAHLLVNFKLKNLPLYTLPFFQEGFATAAGGRGGLGRNVLLDIGGFLHESRFIPFNSIITKEEFLSEDASLTYPVAALYNLFLMEELGIESYLEMYLNYSGDADYVSNLNLNSIKLPSLEKFNKYIESYKQKGGIFIDISEEFKPAAQSLSGTISESENFYRVKIRSNLLLRTADPVKEYSSKKFKEVFPGVAYTGYKYLIKADSREINIYNLYTNILIASYSAGFNTDNKEVPNEEGYFIFYLDKDVFEEEIKELIISDI